MFALFKKDQPAPTLQTSDFKDYLEFTDHYPWVSRYIDELGNIDRGRAELDIANGVGAIAALGMENFKKLVVDLYRQSLEVEQDITDEQYRLVKIIENMPINIEIRRVKSKAAGNNWAVSYNKGTKYYGATLVEALNKLIEKNEKAQKKFAENNIKPAKIQIKVKKG